MLLGTGVVVCERCAYDPTVRRVQLIALAAVFAAVFTIDASGANVSLRCPTATAVSGALHQRLLVDTFLKTPGVCAYRAPFRHGKTSLTLSALAKPLVSLARMRRVAAHVFRVKVQPSLGAGAFTGQLDTSCFAWLRGRGNTFVQIFLTADTIPRSSICPLAVTAARLFR
jgi:hypothetical protein